MLAFTMGSDLYFVPGQYNPQTPQGEQLLGHELTHVVQQRAGRVRNPLGSGVAVVQDPTLEAEAERMGMRAASATSPPLIQPKPSPVSMIGGRPTGPSGAVRVIDPAGTNPGPFLAPAESGCGAGLRPGSISAPTKVGMHTYRIVAGAGGRPMGSAMVHARGDSSIEVTDLKVEDAHRGRGLGGMLMASAMRAGSNWAGPARSWPARMTAAVG